LNLDAGLRRFAKQTRWAEASMLLDFPRCFAVFLANKLNPSTLGEARHVVNRERLFRADP
jgi:hypothetical protein